MTATLHICRGLPGSGKTTFARSWVTEDPEYRVRINRDDVRKLVHTEHYGRDTEAATTVTSHAAIRALLRSGRDVIVDDTNLNAGHVKKLLRIAHQAGAGITWHDFQIDPAEAKRRDATRALPSSRVGEEVIDRFTRYLVNGQLPPHPVLTEGEAPPVHAPYTGTPGKPPAVVVDIDGTLAHNYGHRSFYDFGEAVLSDAVHRPVLLLVLGFIELGHEIVIMSGRDDTCRDLTMQWLRRECDLRLGDYYGPFMRAAGDGRDDGIVKLELFDAHVRDHFDVRYVLDDRNRVVKAWRSIGLTVLQVADGDF